MPLATAIISALVQLGPPAIDAIAAIIRAAHGHDLTDEQHQQLGAALATAVRNAPAATP